MVFLNVVQIRSKFSYPKKFKIVAIEILIGLFFLSFKIMEKGEPYRTELNKTYFSSLRRLSLFTPPHSKEGLEIFQGKTRDTQVFEATEIFGNVIFIDCFNFFSIKNWKLQHQGLSLRESILAGGGGSGGGGRNKKKQNPS